MIVKTTRLNNRAINRVNDLAILLQYLRKQQTKVTFQDALDFAISFTNENYTQVMGNTPSANIAQSNIAEIQPQNIPHEILQTEIPQQRDEPPQQTVPLQTASKKIAGMSYDEIQKKANEPVKDLYNDNIAPSKHLHLVKKAEPKKDFVKKLLAE